MLHEALVASELLGEKGFSLKVVNLPWINRIDLQWLEEAVAGCHTIFTLDNHAPSGGLGDYLLQAVMTSDTLHTKKLIKFAVEGHPACGTPPEALAYHKLDGKSIGARVLNAVGDRGA